MRGMLQENIFEIRKANHQRVAIFGLLITALAGVNGAHAAWIGSPTGYNIVACEASSLNLNENHSITSIRAKGLLITTPNSPDHMAQIECLGTFESLPDKAFKAAGYCVSTDRDGDKWLDRWWVDSTMPKGRWEDTGISGKWKNLRRTGSYVYTDRSSDSGCKGVSSWEADR